MSRLYQGRTRKPKMTLTRPMTSNYGTPPRIMMSHKYFDTGEIPSAVSASGVTATYRLRSMFDPDFTFTGHQPRGRDQMVAAGYTYYSVHAVGLDVKMYVDDTESGFANGLFYVSIGGIAIPFTDQTEVHEIGNSPRGWLLAKKYVPAIQSTASSTAARGSQIYLKKYLPNLWKAAQRFQWDGSPATAEYFDANQYTAVGANPDVDTEVYMRLCSCGVAPGTGSQGFEYATQITYYCEWVRGPAAAS